MVAVKRSKIVLISAAIAAAAGAFLILASIPSSTNTMSFTMPGGYVYYRFETTNLLNGKVSGTFNVTSGNDVILMIFERTEYDSYVETGLATPIYTVAGNNGSFSASLSGMGKLFIVFEHDPASRHFETNVTIDYKVTGIAINFFVIGIVMASAGTALAVVGRRLHKKEFLERASSPSARGARAGRPPPKDQKP